jgi:Ca2+-binding EF-hand superfamily protein
MGAEATKTIAKYGDGSFLDMESLSQRYNISIESIEELRRKFLIYRGRNGKINVHNYVIFYKEYVNMNANDIEIYKSFNAFDANRDGAIDFVELVNAIAWHTGVNRPAYHNFVHSSPSLDRYF